jgi:hypothetical protein
MPNPGDQICSHGTVNSGVAATILIDFAALVIPGIDIPAAFSLILDGIGAITLVTTDLCANPPRYPGDPSLSDLVAWTTDPLSQPALAQKYTQWVIYNLYPVYCTCTTLVPPNTSYPPSPVMPTGSPPLPSQSNPLDLTCNLSQLTNKLNAIYALLRLIAATVGPQGYSLGTPHTVTGVGEFTVSGIVGVVTHALSYAPGTGYVPSDPTRFYDTGFIAFGDGNGWYARRPNLHDPQFHTGAPTGVTRVGFDCGMVTSLEITELLPVVLYTGN